MKILMWHQKLDQVRRDERGAVAFLCLIAILILLLVSWTMFDAGTATRVKVQAQSTADSAAYSQAAIKARSMNMLAYSNISKRSIWGIHSLYPSYMISTHRWIRENINGNCTACQESADPGSTACKICGVARAERSRWVVNACGQSAPQDIRDEFGGAACDPDDRDTWGLFRSYAGYDYSGELRINDDNNTIIDGPWGTGYPTDDDQFGARRILPIGDSRDPGTIFQHYVGQDLRALDNYQRYIAGLTPWWGWSEQLIRSVRNGATVSASWPAPVGQFPNFVYSIRNTLLQFMAAIFPGSYGAGQGHAASLYTDSLPVFPGNVGTMRSHISGIVPSGVDIRSCLISSILAMDFKCGGVVSQIKHPFFLEHVLNVLYFAIQSEGLVGGEYAWSSTWGALGTYNVHKNALFDDFKDLGLRFTENSAAMNLGDDRIVAEPWLLEKPRHPADWKLKTSNLVLSYIGRDNQFDENRGARQKFSLLEDYRNTANQTQRGRELQQHFYGGLPRSFSQIQEVTYGTSGYWSMSRAEIFFNVEQSKRTTHRPDLWRPSWQARLRPVSLPGEFDQGQYMISQVFREVMMTIAIGSALGVSNVNDLMQAAVDLLNMERASMSMGPSTVEGISK